MTGARPADTSPPAREEARRREAIELDAEILAAIGGGWEDPLPDAEFDALARAVFAHQFRFNPVYRQFCLMREVGAPADVGSWREIPPVPTGAFKVGRWATFPREADAVTFRTSGTTGEGRGTHAIESLGLANAAVVVAARRFLVPDVERIRCLFLSPPPRAVADSSLVHMFAVYREALGAPGSRFFLEPGGRTLDANRLEEALGRAEKDEVPVLVAGAALAFHHVLATLAGRWDLPGGSRALVTGGFKGVRTATDPAGLAQTIADRLGIPLGMQVEEYGMTELSSQAYTGNLRADRGLDERAAEEIGVAGRGPFRVPPWVRVRVVDPLTGADVGSSREGVVVVWDLANRGTALVVQTSDLARPTGVGGFELRGRAPGAEARGCSLAADLWLSRA